MAEYSQDAMIDSDLDQDLEDLELHDNLKDKDHGESQMISHKNREA